VTERVLIAGIGNIFFGDDGFGVEVVRRLAREARLGAHVDVVDVGIAGLHLAYRLIERYALLIAVDAIARGGAPGTLYVLEPSFGGDGDGDGDGDGGVQPDGHSIDLRSVLAMARALGAEPCRALVVGCEPSVMDEGIGLSAAVTAAVEPAMHRIRQLAEGRGEP
jgi:hydrogenase maturation protease